MIKNSYDFDNIDLIKKKYSNIKKMLKRYKQNGGTFDSLNKIDGLKDKLYNIESMIGLIKNGSNVNYSDLLDALERIKNNIDTHLKNPLKDEDKEGKAKGLFLNLLPNIEEIINGLELKYTNTPKVVAPISIPGITGKYKEIVDELDTMIESFNQEVDANLDISNADFVSKAEALEVGLQNLSLKIVSIKEREKALKEKILLLESYNQIILNPTNMTNVQFISSSDALMSKYPTELVEMQQLSDIENQTATIRPESSSLSNPNIGDFSRFVEDFIGPIDKIMDKEIINPNFKDIDKSPILTFDNLTKVISKVIDKINSYESLPTELRDKNIQKQINQICKLMLDLMKKTLEEIQNYLKINDNIFSICSIESLKKDIIDNITKINELYEKFNTKYETKNLNKEDLEEFKKLLQVINIQKLDIIETVNSNIKNCESKFNLIIENNTKILKNKNTKLKSLKTEFDKIKKNNTIYKNIKIDSSIEELNPIFSQIGYESVDIKNFKRLMTEYALLNSSNKEQITRLNQEITDAKQNIDKLKPLELKGGSYNKYMAKIRDMYYIMNEFKVAYNNFIHSAKKFNLKYIQLYNHQLYISSYINLVLLKTNYKVYTNVTKGTIEYYYRMVNKLFILCTEAFKNKTLTGKNIIGYFFKYHFITLNILNQFLKFILDNWGPNGATESEMNSNKLLIDTITDDTIKYCFFLFNLFKDILDAYALEGAPPVATYLRINDYDHKETDEDGNETFVRAADNIIIFQKNEDGQDAKNYLLDKDKLETCDVHNPKIQKNTSKVDSDPTNFNKKKDIVAKIEFRKIFDPKGFSDNSVLAMYMGLPNYLSRGQSIMLMTYGYSGVGKTYTLFGGSDKPGILQTALQNIKGMKGIYMRTYEIYGRSLPYKSVWLELPRNKYNQQVFSYVYNKDGKAILSRTIDGSNITNLNKFLDSIKGSDTSSYIEMDTSKIKNFQKDFVEEIDKIRKSQGRIKATINNPESSRSIMVYEFKIILSNDKCVRFVVMDLPGKEDVKNTYLSDDIKDQELICLNLKQEIKGSYHERAVKAACFMNPLFISLFPIICNQLINYTLKNIKDIPEINNHKISIRSEDAYREQISLINRLNSRDLSELHPRYTTGDPSSQRVSNPNYIRPFTNCVLASEIVKCIIINNKIEFLIKFYKDELIFTCDGQDNDINAPFEAFYINENLLGLIELLKGRLNKNKLTPVQIDEKLYKNTNDESILLNNPFSEIMIRDGGRIVINKTGNPIKIYTSNNEQQMIQQNESFNIYYNELIAQTYFLRDLLRTDGKIFNVTTDNIGGYYLDSKYEYVDSHYNGLLESSKYKDKSIKEWIEDSYVFNKAFTKDPPIRRFMESYFGTETNNEDTINNFYLFYVVSNNNIGKCANQNALIADSNDFIHAINSYEENTGKV